MNTDETRLQFTTNDGRIVMSGEVDASTCTTFDDWLDEQRDGGPILLDMAEVTFIDSSGLRVLIAHHQRSCADGRSFEILDPSRTVQRLLEITGLTEGLHIRTT